MIRSLKRILLTFLIGMHITPIAAAQEKPPHFTGDWRGELTVGSQKIPILFHISPGTGDTLKATMDSPRQGVTDLPVSDLSIQGARLKMTITVASAYFEGHLIEGMLSGHWVQAGQKFPLILERYTKDPAPAPQAGPLPLPYDETEVFFKNTTTSNRLAGTLSIPKISALKKAVVLITGSGPQDRDQSFMGHKTFKVLADHLARNGIIVLRVDDRGVGKSEGEFYKATSLDFASDTSAAVAFLKEKSDLPIQSIGLIGHSEGGLIAPLVANSNEDVSFVVMLAGPGLKGDEIAVEQVRRFLRYSGVSEKSADKGSRMTAALNHTVLTHDDRATLSDALKKSYQSTWASFNSDTQKTLTRLGGGSLSAGRLQQLMLPWTKYFLGYDPQETLNKLTIPVLALHGSKDTQMRSSENLKAIKLALSKNVHSMSVIKEIEGVNHLFQTADTGLMNEYASIKETMAPRVLELIVQWINQTP
ncbi:alpha/beta fold hydrolase [Temperatibacter marinus]|uniref:Alpha/beta fold hydrolase n=1 Tax=Temperatibacter marinus TaxID=1456591 RepID=A0AA52EJY1_9PROT|nr:alpha/beta fold hydrolase [Temperatibacter marinus]WND03859.1 alpha/beta fold hydrolase [Temperatibacter marinus]